ncbi:MAG: Hpt domain-containing protein, partial [Dehalococcoidia bacterium]
MSAEAETLSGQVERISEMLVLAEADDLQALAAVHTCFEDLSRLADREQREDISGAAGASAALLERVMLGEVEDAGTSLGVVGRAVSALQAMCRDGSGAADAGLPPELGLEAEGGGGFALPANVDESILSEFLARQGGVLQEMEALVLVLESGEDDESLASFKRLVHTMKGEAALLGLGEVEQLCHATEDLLG